MLYNRVFRTVIPPVLSSASFDNIYQSGYDDYDFYVPYDSVVTFNQSPTTPVSPPPPYTSWWAMLQTSTNGTTWTDTTDFKQLSTNTTDRVVISTANQIVGNYYRVQVVLRNAGTGAVEEKFSVSNATTQVNSFTLVHYKAYGDLFGVTSAATFVTGITAPPGANAVYGYILSGGGNGAASNGVLYGGGGGGGRLINGFTLSGNFAGISWNIGDGGGYWGVWESTGNRYAVKNGGDGGLGTAGLGAVAADDDVIGTWNVIADQDGADATTSTGGFTTYSISPYGTGPLGSTGPFSSAGTAQIGSMAGAGGNGVPVIYAGATPAAGVGGNVYFSFAKA